MFSYRAISRTWVILCTIAALLAFILFWGPPSWTTVFPQGMVYRFLDALWCDVFAMALFCAPAFLRVEKKLVSVLSFIAGSGFLVIFWILVILAKSLIVLDFLVLAFAIVVLCTLFFLSAVQTIAKKEETPSMARQVFLRRIWSLATPVLWLAFFILGHFFTRLWPAFYFIGGLSLLSPLVGVFLMNESGIIRLSTPDSKGKFGISAREAEVFALLTEGLTNQEIADRLFISITTVKSHLSHMYDKTGSRNRVELMRIIRSNDGESDFRGMVNP